MKSVKCVSLFLLVCGITTLNPPVSCSTTGEIQPSEEPELIDIDIKSIDSTKLKVEKAPDSPEIDNISPKDNKIINSIKIGEHTLWKKLPTTECLNFLKFRTKTDKIFVTLNTLNNGEKFYINIVHDPTDSTDSGTSGVNSIAKKPKYIGIIPFLIKLNEEFGANKEAIIEAEGTQLNIEGIFDKWYFKYSSKTTNMYESNAKDVFLYEIYEPNDQEKLSKIRNNRGKIWPPLEEEESNKKVVKKVEVYWKNGKASALELTITDESKVYLFNEAEKNTFGKIEQDEFKNKLKEAGFTDAMKEIESGTQRALVGDTIKALNIDDINKENFDFVKNRLSTVRIVTAVPKEKKRVNELKFNERQTYSVDSDDYTIDIIKWNEDSYSTETIIRHEDDNYNCHYTEQRRDDTKTYYLDQEVFYNSVKKRIANNESKYVTYTPFNLLYQPPERVEGPEAASEEVRRSPQTKTQVPESNEKDVQTGSRGQTSEREQKERTSGQKTAVNSGSATSDKTQDAGAVTGEQGGGSTTEVAQTPENTTLGGSPEEDLGPTEITQLTDALVQLMSPGGKQEIEDFDEPMTLGENIIAKAEELLQKIEDIHSRVKTKVEKEPKNNEETYKINIDEIKENCLRDSIEFLKFIKSKSKEAKPDKSPKEPSPTVDKAIPEEVTKSGFMTKGLTVTMMMLAAILI